MKNKYIGLLADDSPGLSIGVLSILKSGNCFVPINPQFPNDRARFIIDDCNINTLLTDKANYEKARQIIGETSPVKHLICIDDMAVAASKGVMSEVEGVKAPYCYVIYTSGSTGKPKGVPIAHQNLVPLFHWFRDYFGLGVHTRVMQNLSYTFDFGVFEILTTHLFGGRLYMVNKATVGDFSLYAYFINRMHIDTLHTTPVFFNNIANSGQKMIFIKLLHLGGERLTGAIVQNALNTASPGCFIYNGYGPTEASINCAIFSLAGKNTGAAEKDNIPIGRPSALHEIYILDKFAGPQPIGVAGELCIAGPGLSPGYLNRPELTAKRFIHFHHSSFIIHHSNLYCTGDLARWLPDGNIEFLGRIDHQVKVRGFRIELGEIESCLSLYPAIKEVVVIARQYENRGNYLCAYIVPQSPGHPTVSQLREYLSKQLPDYMIPAYFIHLERIPLTANGKIDRKALPGPDETFIDTGVEYVAPGTETEKKLAFIWRQLLRLERIGINDDFFQLGGDSILVNRCIARIREELHAEIPLRKFFEQPYIKALAEEIEKQERQVSSIKPAAREGEIPLSFAQERLWFLQELDADNVAYFVPRVIRMTGKLDISIIERTFTEIIRRHEILRTTFHTVDGQPVQRIQAPYPIKIQVLEWVGLEKQEQEQRIANFLNEEGQRPFDFEKGPLLRVAIIKLKDEEHLFVLTEHHLVHDGWTQGVLLREFIAIFSAYADGKGRPLADLPIQYADFAIWQRNHLTGDVLERHLAYWKEKLAGLAPVLELPGDRPRPPVISGRGDLEIVRLSGSYTLRLKEFSRKNGVTLFMTMLAVFKTLLYRYTGVEDLCVGAGVANRRYKEMEGMLGMVINTLLLRTQVEGEIPFTECLKRVKETCLEAYQHEDTPFGKIVEVMQPERNLSYTPLFQVLFNFMDTPGEALALPGLELELLPTHNRSAKFDINVVVAPPPEQEENEPGETLIEWEYNTDIFDASTFNRLISHYNRLMEEGLNRPETPLSSLPMLSDTELKQVLYEFNDTKTIYPRDKTIHQLLEEQVEKSPDRIALVGAADSVSLSYSKLNEQSDRLAGGLIEKGILVDDIVGIMLGRSIDLIIGIMGILKAGAAYLPIDPEYPRERIDYMLKDSAAKILLTEAECVFNFHHSSFIIHHSNHLAYILYTSGSTGRPKGVVVKHESVVNLLFALFQKYPFNQTDCYLLKTTYVFDVSVTELFGWFLGGGRLAILEPGGEKDPQTIINTIENSVVTHIDFVPTMFTAFLDSLNQRDIEALRSLKYIFLAGEAVKPESVEKFKQLNTAILLENLYGPTENTVYAGGYSLNGWSGDGPVPIGKPLPNIELYILDKYNHLQPVGVPGELCISGVGTAAGYLNRPELTAEKFSHFHHSSFDLPRIHHSKLYCTGDWARWLSGGNIEFLGRIDQQVKIRGFRIELGEIENRLAGHPLVKEAVVMDLESGGDKYLCAYVVPRACACDAVDTTVPGELKRYLAIVLPDYMIPPFFVFTERIPLTPSGKINRRALPKPEIAGQKQEYTAPRDPMEEKLAEIWTEVLNINTGMAAIGIDDNFFQLGGHSLKAMILAAKIHKAFAVKIPLAQLFKSVTIRALTGYIKQKTGQKDGLYTTMEAVEKKEYYPLSSAQERLFFLQQMDIGGTGYNIPILLELIGDLHIETLTETFIKLIRRHESLRTSFHVIAEAAVQAVHQEVDF
ncbi:MAG: amino acid adenylation domain-containing protein, partial [Candidatus Aminicenantes bacterium]|nr:amino acid adenylation domain-containing protein [Candidatus Aminicenantes bacterium]